MLSTLPNSFPKILVDMHIYYMEESVLLGTKPFVDSIRHFIRRLDFHRLPGPEQRLVIEPTSSGTRVAYFPYVTFVPVKHSPPYNK